MDINYIYGLAIYLVIGFSFSIIADDYVQKFESNLQRASVAIFWPVAMLGLVAIIKIVPLEKREG
ncbi:TMhelix containing protein [Vibrio phage 1.181.O._10N.286.46.C9]|nr:TMhelix containing protein [Vibrio phage 1.181.O._10N.286.46.C9]